MERLVTAVRFFPGLLQRCYKKVLEWSAHENAVFFLFGLAFAEASFFPIPPDVMLITMGLAAPRRSFRWALICLIGSVLGGIAGYGLGYYFMELIGNKILIFYHLTEKYTQVQELFHQYDAWAVAVGGFTPLPYKLFTITAGAFKIDILTFFLASVVSRGLRFYLVAGLIYMFGPKVQFFLERYFNLFTILFTIALIGGYLVVKWLL